jgi:hypothetical protein
MQNFDGYPQVEISEIFWKKNLDNRRARAQPNRYFCLSMLLYKTCYMNLKLLENLRTIHLVCTSKNLATKKTVGINQRPSQRRNDRSHS